MDPSSPEASERYCYNPMLRWNRQVEEYFVKAYGAEQFFRISKALTHPTSYSCIRVNTLQTSVDDIICKLQVILQEQNGQNVIASLCMGKGDPAAYEDYHLKLSHSPQAEIPGYSKCPSIHKCSVPGLDNILFIKGSGPHAFQYGNCSPLKEVIVSRKCAEAVLRGAQVFVPGVLACSSHVEKGDVVAISVAVEQPRLEGDWGVGITRGTVLQGMETDPHYHERNGLYIGQGVAMMSRAGMFRASEGIAVGMLNKIYELPSFHDVLEGEIFLQNLPSIVAAHVLDPREGERILDMCAAPGGKTTAIAALMGDKGEVVALDRSHNKVMDILKLGKEMGLKCISAFKLDALKAVVKESGVHARNLNAEFLSEEKSDHSSKKPDVIVMKYSRRKRNGPGKNNLGGCRAACSKGFMSNSFDRVLLDAPCSALGLRPRLFAGEETVESLRNHAKYQRKMFDQAVQLVRPGGVIVYSTCTINPGENEVLVRYALDTYKFLSLAAQHPRIGGPGLVGCCNLDDGAYIEKWLTEDEAELVQRFDPSSSLDTIGFFIAKFSVGRKDV